ncbi:unnamed protein product, partial [Mesorhabditis spiculigera]
MSSGSSDSGSDVEMDEEDLLDLEDLDDKIATLKQQLAAEPYNTKLHAELCSVLRKNGDLEELEAARNRWNDIAPLPVSEWINWAKDQIGVKDDKADVEAVFNKAFLDFNYGALWIEYVQWACGHGPEYARKVFEAAIVALGLRFDSGYLIWQSYLDVENLLLVASEGRKEADIARIVDIYKRALRIPSIKLADLFASWQQFGNILCLKLNVNFASENTVDEETQTAVKAIYVETAKKSKDLNALETKLAQAEKPMAVYDEYLAYEKESQDIARIESFFERVVENQPDNENVWFNYGQWLEEKLKIPSKIRSLYERAVRNCYYSCGLWQKTLLAVEGANGSDDELEVLWIKAKECISSADDARILFPTYAYLQRRRGEANKDYSAAAKIFADGQEFMRQRWLYDWDPEFTYRRNYAWFAFTRLDDYKLGHRIWEDILASGGGRLADQWLTAIRDERQFGKDPVTARKMFYRALNSVSDHPQKIYAAVVQYEREEGTFEQLQHGLEKVNAQIMQRKDRPQKKEREEKKPVGKGAPRTRDDSNGPQRGGSAGEKRKADTHTGSPVEKKLRAEPPIATKAISSTAPVIKDNDGFVVPGLPVRSTPPASPSPDASHPAAGPSNDGSNQWIVFVSNLDFKCPESAIEEVLNPGVVKVDLKYRGMSKLNSGFGSVVMDSQENYEAALKKDRTLIGSRPLYVSKHTKKDKSDDGASSLGTAPAFKYATGLERNKLFVKNVHYNTKEDELMEVFAQFGRVLGARIVTHKSGQSKGMAYVDMENEEAAKKAIEAKDLVLRERALEVLLSNPPKKSSAPIFNPLMRKGHASLIQLVPRSTRVAPTNSNKTPATGAPSAAGKMSNDQFRQFLKK